MKRRRQIEMTPEECDAMLEASKTIILGTIDPKGFPHLVPMWFRHRDGRVAMTTFRKSQKVRNLERDPKATLLVESGETYADLKGVMIRSEVEIVDEPDRCFEVLRDIQSRYGTEMHESMVAALREQAKKRVALVFEPRHVSSWDHAKLAGAY